MAHTDLDVLERLTPLAANRCETCAAELPPSRFRCATCPPRPLPAAYVAAAAEHRQRVRS
jgi:hypothetical protein